MSFHVKVPKWDTGAADDDLLAASSKVAHVSMKGDIVLSKKSKGKKNKEKAKSRESKEKPPKTRNVGKGRKRDLNDDNQHAGDDGDDGAATNEPAEKVVKKQKATTSDADKYKNRLAGSRFRWINEQLYTIDGAAAKKMFDEDPSLFEAYHTGFKQQVEQWPVNPLDRIAEYIKTFPSDWKVADLGCGEGKLKDMVKQQVHCFDLVADAPHVIACDITSRVPLDDNSMDVCVFCLSLMNTNYTSSLREAHRILRQKGWLLIAEVSSRITNVEKFKNGLQHMGFGGCHVTHPSSHFIMIKTSKVASEKRKVEGDALGLSPCIYKRR